MKLSERWLREWVELPLATAELLEQLTMLGLEVDFTEPAAADMPGVVVGRVLSVAPHPNADALRVCRVEAGTGGPFDVVCGAPNVREGLCAPFARPGARLPGGVRIEEAELRGVRSSGMLCSEKELAMSEDAGGLMELADDAEPGRALADYLALDDTLIDIDLTPNRGDCLSVRGVARDLAARNRVALRAPVIPEVPAACDATFPVRLDEPGGCPRYVGRVIRGIDPAARSPRWMVERLRRSGIRAISPTVDVTNYVMLELGQPMHAFDLAELRGGIHVRAARPGETLVMLDGAELTLDPQVLVIADERGAVALAGIMGGEHSGVGEATRDIFLESAFFDPAWITGRLRRFQLFTDSGQRFERGVDPAGQREAVERATALLLEICGGEPGPVSEVCDPAHLPVAPRVMLRPARIERLLGEPLAAAEVEDILDRLGLTVERAGDVWHATPPSHRFDIRIEPDLIEELARIRGYERIAEAQPAFVPRTVPAPEPGTGLDGLRALLLARGYSEAVTYSFVDEALARCIEPAATPLALANPISSELAVMRPSLWPGLLSALRHNLNRQQNRVRLFETGLVFDAGAELRQIPRLGAVVCGALAPEQWGTESRAADFYDVKGDLQALLALSGQGVVFRAAAHPALHPGQSAELLLEGERCGWLGALHPRLEGELGIDRAAILFELDLAPLTAGRHPRAMEVSRFPSIRRDISILVDHDVSAESILASVWEGAPASLTDVIIFDVYAGKGVVSGRKSVSLGLILQELSLTLTDQMVDEAVGRILAGLHKKLGATLRE